MWDVDAAVAEVEWAHDAGLRGVNFPAMRDGELPEYNQPRWEPLWSVCEERRMPLVTHVGGGTNARYSGLEGVALLQIESGSVHVAPGRLVADLRRRLRAPPRPEARDHRDAGQLVPGTAAELDAVWAFYDAKRDEPLNKALLEQVPRRPSEYMAHERVLRSQLRVTVRGRAGRRARARLPAAVGLGLPAPRRHLRVPRRRATCRR